MGRHSSDSEEERKKRKKKKKKKSRSRSGSIESRHSSKLKKSKKTKRKNRSRSRSPDSRHKKSRSSRSRTPSRRRSRSHDRYRSRSRSRERHRRRSRSPSRDRYSRSRSRERRRRRSRSRSRSHERSSKRSRSYSPSRVKRERSSAEREDPCSSIPGFASMTPAEQARIRMHMALKAAAAADEKLKGEVPRNQSSNSLQDSLQFSQAIQDIESSSFSAASFKSNRGDKREEPVTVKDEFMFGTAGELRLDPSQRKPVIVNVDTDELAHPSLYADQEEKLDRWIQKLTAMRRKKLEGEALAMD